MAQLPAPTVGLTAKQIAFAEAYVAQGGHHHERAAVAAGYSNTSKGAHVRANELLRHPGVLAYLRWLAETKIKAQVVASAATLELIRDDPTAQHSTRLKAASELLDRAGMMIERIQTIVVDDRRRSSAGDLRELVDTVISLDIGVVVGDPAKLQRALELAQQRDSSPAIIDITPDDEAPEVEQEKPAKSFAAVGNLGANRPDPALSDEALAAIL